MDQALEQAFQAVVTAAIPVILAIVFSWLQLIMGESNARRLISAAKEAVLA